ncbi:class I SAM-dependent methyltransferase [Streptomyces sp. NPDC001691]|uniref:class I SAM-dependent methyltransferase n=1 Tax=Streptomyces sp. NPDC001691 TaxID=3364600 RepID=UPI0036BF7A10
MGVDTATTPKGSSPDGFTAEAYRDGVIGHRVQGELRRLQLLEQMLDPPTQALLVGLGIAPNWRCAEVGAGAGSVARWLASQCPQGRVTATDIDTDFLDRTTLPDNVEVVRHDVAVDDFEPGTFDLVHTRAVLAHVPQRDAVLAKMCTWLAPGGLLVVEDPTFFTVDTSPHPEFARMIRAVDALLATSQGSDSGWARRIPAAMEQCGLTDVRMSMTASVCGLGGVDDAFWKLSFAQAAPALVQHELLSQAQVDEAIARLDEPGFTDVAWCFVSCWARRPDPLTALTA